jgi:hypothetical protein
LPSGFSLQSRLIHGTTITSGKYSMQEAFTGGWARESHWPQDLMGSLKDLNQRFLDLAATGTDAWRSSAADDSTTLTSFAGRLAPLSAAQRAAAAGCPYALFDLRFQDVGYWRARLQQSPRHVADEPRTHADVAGFSQLATFFAWHVACSSAAAARLLLGMAPETAAAFAGLTVDCLPSLAAGASAHLGIRWSDCNVYWTALVSAAFRTDAALLRRVQLCGLQLAAAAQLPAS